ncbi:hypothetical protein [Nitrosococcus oceani]|uniref:hypothetical protein n=1 Tax=Nitrosococcus oceani TaxID=1229 RepID=UPI0005615A6B|nr:hypothetical protein [Nitrosococcus oceani]
MAKDWKELTTDELLNFNGPETAEIARFERIMQQRTAESLREFQSELSNTANHINQSTDRIVGVGNRLIKTIEAQGGAQKKHQRSIVWLTVVIAVATVAYVIITWFSVQTMQEANDIQRKSANIERSGNTKT